MYGELAEEDVKVLVLDDKWQATIAGRVAHVVDSLTLALVDRTKELSERYAQTIDQLNASLTDIETKVEKHLAAMGVRR